MNAIQIAGISKIKMPTHEETILVLEDEPIIALDLVYTLEQARLGKVVVVASCHEAEDWLLLQTPDFAIIDIHLKDGICREVVKTLSERSVRFLIHSGYEEEHHLELPSCRWLSKPCLPQELVRAVEIARSS